MQRFKIDERDWEPDELRDDPERARRFRRWSEDCRGFPNAMRWQYGDDYQDKVTKIIKEWNPVKAAKMMHVSEEEASKRLEIALSDRWKER